MSKRKLSMPDIEINDDFNTVFDLVENQNINLFLTGNAGTGKSTFLQYLKSHSSKNIAVVSPTGKAALACGGQTIHSFFKFPHKLLMDDQVKRHRDTRKFEELDLLIIDEISMVRADLMDAIDLSLQLNRNNRDPFGGVQVLLIGDLGQLPPVVKDKELQDYFENIYEVPYFFAAQVFDEVEVFIYNFEKIYRQQDRQFIDLLNSIRMGSVSEELINTINKRVMRANRKWGLNGLITLTTTNNDAYNINRSQLEKLKTKEHTFSASIIGKFPEGSFPTDRELKLKVGAQIMMLVNDPKKRWVNGTMAKLKKITDDELTVEIDGLAYPVQRYEWNNIEYTVDRRTGEYADKVVGTFEQFPVALAYATTIHKSQGMTLEKVIINLGNGSFSHGQTYVALSRCRTLDGIFLNVPLTCKDIIFDFHVDDVYSKFHLYTKEQSCTSPSEKA